MAVTDSGFADWLKSEALYSASTVAGAGAAWGDLAVDSEVISPLALVADAATEAAYQSAFLTGPLGVDTVEVPGYRSDLQGQLVTITGDRLGYEAGADVFVLGVAESDSGNTSTLTVIKRLQL